LVAGMAAAKWARHLKELEKSGLSGTTWEPTPIHLSVISHAP